MLQYRNTISSLQATLDILTGLRRIRERIPMREAVSGVVNDRREFVGECSSHDPRSGFLIHEVHTILGILCMRLAVRM